MKLFEEVADAPITIPLGNEPVRCQILVGDGAIGDRDSL